MPGLRRFWRSLEVLEGCATVPAQWKQLLADEYDRARQFLRCSGELATFYPHRDPYLLIYRVVTHGPEDHVGICDETGERIVLTTADLVIEELDQFRLGPAIAYAFGLRYDDRPLDGMLGARRIGHYVPLAGFRFPVFLAIPPPSMGLDPMVDRLLASRQEPFLLMVPSRRTLRSRGEELLRRRKAGLVPLDEGSEIDEHGRLAATPCGRRAIDEFRKSMVPSADDSSDMAFFPTPPEATWKDVKIRLVDGHTVSVCAGAAHGVFNYTQLGLANRKNGSPSVQWELLRAFAAGSGILTWRSPAANRRNQKRRELLARALQAFFRIDGDPIVSQDDGWRTRFAITDTT